MKKLLSLLLTATVLSPSILAHGDNSHFPREQDITVRTTKVAGNVYMLQGRGGNIGAIVGPEGILIVDDDYKVVSEKLAAALKELGSASPKYVFNTHWHGDHTEGNEYFGKSSTIVAHTNVRKRLSQTNTVFGRTVAIAPVVSWPVITYTASMSIFFNGEEIQAVHYPNSHTDGDTVVFFKGSNVVHFGDMFFAGRFPFVDLENGGSVQGLINNIGSLIQKIPADAKLIPGHGPICTVADLKNYHSLIVDSAKIVEDAMKAGKPLEDIKKAGFPERFKEAGSGFIKTDQWIETIYRSYSLK
ncbi:MAG TPA: MBL fold metallo-hydrolase [Pyrinomonadaceae bacterium]|nr:MBL fold metallo-hydrolase [Chloracidobacterium sp.]HBE81279.1 MBL fold metallo-hydrolase [Blastocatellia bacterium]HRJ88023.1 MBL fold metallo-hydrolase [Pyrinomonadaceae bacterium]HRK51229.1 MBL fold metallo-hydrolase [Pyrinomonadaceae bacterium]